MSRRLLSVALLFAALPSTALAWEHTARVWLPEDMPLRYWVADDGQPNSIQTCLDSGGTTGCCEETVPAGYCIESAFNGFDAWNAAQCAEFDFEYQGVCNNVNNLFNNLSYFTFNDPGSESGGGTIDEVGTWAVTYTIAIGTAFVLDGQVYSHAQDSDIVFNDNAVFDTDERIDLGTCNGGASFRAVFTHEIGHLLGMGHSCEDPDKGGEPCNDPVLRDATMYWAAGVCDTHASTINEDDIQGFTALYGPYATFQCSHQVSDDLSVGVVPMELNCVIVSEYLNEVTAAEWNFGDGGTSNELNPTHTYTEPGNYTIQVTVQGDREACGPDGWENSYRKVGYVRACDVPEASFEVDHVDGLKYRMLNESDVSVYGCISDIQWEVYAGDKASGEPIMPPIKAWEPTIEFPDNGTYTVVMNLGGIAGTGAAKVVFDAKNRAGEGYGCSTTGTGAGATLALGALGLLIRRRR